MFTPLPRRTSIGRNDNNQAREATNLACQWYSQGELPRRLGAQVRCRVIIFCWRRLPYAKCSPAASTQQNRRSGKYVVAIDVHSVRSPTDAPCSLFGSKRRTRGQRRRYTEQRVFCSISVACTESWIVFTLRHVSPRGVSGFDLKGLGGRV